MVKITVVNLMISHMSRKDFELIEPCLTYTKTYWKQGRHSKTEEEYDAVCYINKIKKRVSFYTGHLDRILDYCDEKGIKHKVDRPERIRAIPTAEPYLPGITFHDKQSEFIQDAIHMGQGVIQAATAFGKTVTFLGILSCFPKAKILVLVHTVDLVIQIREDFEKYEFDDVVQIGGGKKFKGSFGRINVATVQTMYRLDPEVYRNEFDIVVVDETHHVSKFTGFYARVLGQCYAPTRFGFTATLPDEWEQILAIEAFIGGMIGTFTIDEAIEAGIIVPPKVRIFKSDGVLKIRSVTNYHEVYDRAVINNEPRNNQIMRIVKEHNDQGISLVVMITRIEHGDNLMRCANHHGVQAKFVRGESSGDVRAEIRHAMIEKDIMCVVTTVWREGIDVPTLGGAIIGGCGKSFINTLQIVGRTLRKSEGKTKGIIIDFFDPCHRFLIDQFGERVSIYTENGWL